MVEVVVAVVVLLVEGVVSEEAGMVHPEVVFVGASVVGLEEGMLLIEAKTLTSTSPHRPALIDPEGRWWVLALEFSF